VDPLAGQRVQVDRQRRHQRLAFASAHLGDLAGMQHHAADQLHVEVPHLQHPLAAFAHDRKGLGQQRVERLGLRALAQRVGHRAQLGIGELLELRLERVDALHHTPVLLEEPVVAAAEEGGEELGQHARREGSELAGSAGGPAGHPARAAPADGGPKCERGVARRRAKHPTLASATCQNPMPRPAAISVQ